MKKSTTYSIVLAPEMMEYLRSKAEKEDRSVSAVVRGLVKNNMEKDKSNGL